MHSEQYSFQLDLEVTSVNDKFEFDPLPSTSEIKTTKMSLMLKGKPAHRDHVLPTTMTQRRGNPEAQQPSA